MTQPDRRLLEFASHHRIIVAAQVTLLLRESLDAAAARMAALRDGGLIRDARRTRPAPAAEQITSAGIRAIASPLRAPRYAAADGYHHDVGLGWLWLAAGGGAFGRLRDVVSERVMRSHDARTGEWTDRFGVRLGGVGPAGRERLHYPDLVLVTESGRRVALELELTSKSPARREGILAGYAADPRIDAVVYMVESPAVGQAVSASASRLGIADLVHVQRVSFEPPGRGTTASASAQRLSAHTHKPVAALEAG